jgi:SAM-dependent methyltransferase
MSTEFDQYAPAYSDLLRDPIRDRFASGFRFFHERKLALIFDFLRRQHIAPETARWLDVGCGRGDLLDLGASRFGRAVGCDPSVRMTEVCTSAEVFTQTSPTELPFPDSSFDFATAVCVYHHVPRESRSTLTTSIHRILKPNGVFCMVEHNPWNPITQLIVKRCPVDRDADLLTASRAAQTMRASNFDVLETSYFLYFPERIFSRVGCLENSLRRWPLGGQFALFGRKIV